MTRSETRHAFSPPPIVIENVGEQIANMLESFVMARRPEIQKREEILSREDLKALTHSLAHLSVQGVRDFYERAYQQCRITGRDFPPARTVQELVRAWKQLRKWR